MSTSTARLFVSNPNSIYAQSFKGYLERIGGYQSVELVPLSEMPAPDKAHCMKQMLRNELKALKPRLRSCLDFIRLAENNDRFSHELPALRRERDELEYQLASVRSLLEKGGLANA